MASKIWETRDCNIETNFQLCLPNIEVDKIVTGKGGGFEL